MVRKKGYPGIGELVICRITNINPHSAFAHLPEYGKDGMIHISEIRSGWVKNIKNYLNKGKEVIAKVLDVDKRKGHITLSLKRVDENQENQKKKEYKMEQKAEKMLEEVAKEKNLSLDKAYNKIGYNLQDKIGSLYKGFKTSLENEKLLQKRGIPKDWIKIIKQVAEKNIEQKEFEFKANLKLESFDGDGIYKIKGLLKKLEKTKMEVKYISAPIYMLIYKSKSAKQAEKQFSQQLKGLKSKAEQQGIEASYKLIKT